MIQLRPDLPGLGEQVFGVHHPNGAVKKLSTPHAQGFATVVANSASAINVSTNVAVSGGSSGSGLFDLAGRLTGVLSNGNPCAGGNLNYFPSAGISRRSLRAADADHPRRDAGVRPLGQHVAQ